MTQASLTPAAALMLLALGALWGGSFFLAEIALREVPPMTITLHRVFWAIPLLALVVRARGAAIPRAPRVWGAYLVMGALNNALPFTLIFWGQTRIESGLAAILNGTTAVFGAVVAGLLLADERLTGRKIAGAALGLAGVAVVMGWEALASFDPRNTAQLAVIAAALCYALASVWAKRTLSAQAPQMNALGMLAGSCVLMAPLALIVDGPPRVDLGAGTWAALLALAVCSTSLAYLLYFAILRRAGAANLMLVTLIIPPFAVALGAAFLGEAPGTRALAGFAVIATGILVTDGRVLRALRRGDMSAHINHSEHEGRP
ncbi:DMT family transporter [Roseovarius spongiae]|uniref:DMT family transporter n=1 Tax=Roseovarius spongiae TaxID=2320272 RepID=A0A3A8AZ53_9RHOB|nr:DMT family transporter [Roseovarius spongiae]RKF16849.1 DMT family transporter [Roseovarius spongiae]